jgi:type VII secretion-associated serine protease mycosin
LNILRAMALATAVVASSAAPAAAAMTDETEPWVAVVEAGGSIRVERVEALSAADAAHRVDRETGGAPILALEVDIRASATLLGIDPLRSVQWALDQLGFESTRAAVDPSSVTVAVLDSGVDGSHEDLAGAVLPGWDAITEQPGGDTDTFGHGTHVAGIVAALAGNGLGVTGAAAGVRILPVRVLDTDGSGWSSDIANGIRWAADQGADVINLSLGGTTPSSAYRTAIDYAVNQRGAVVVASAGNEYQSGNPVEYPAAYPDAIAVGASNSAGGRASFSNTGSYVDLAAPGTSIMAPCPMGGAICSSSSPYTRMSGTSMAAPFVSAAAALLRAAQPTSSAGQIRDWLSLTATDAGAAGRDDEFGFGIIDPRRALAAAAGTAPGTPDPVLNPATSPPAAPSPAPSGVGQPGEPVGSDGGYWMVGADGTVYSFGTAAPLGNAPVGAAAAVDLEPTRSGQGYWVVDDGGRVFAFGKAAWHGNVAAGTLAPGEQVTSLSATAGGGGYWIFTTRGRVLAFGDAVFLGDVHTVPLNGAVLDSIPTPSGAGYYLVAADGGIFTFGDARFAGSMGGHRLNAPVQSLVPDPDGSGYWLVAADGGIFAFDADFHGSMGGHRLNRPVTGMVPYGNGYLMVAEDGGIFAFSNLPFAGSLAANPPARPITAVAAPGRR